MDSLAKSHILKELSQAIDAGKNFVLECRLRKSSKTIKIEMSLTEPETFTDANGVIWIRK